MANPSLKAKIEAAKSALESGQAATPDNHATEDTTELKTGLNTRSENKLESSEVTETPAGSELSAAAFDMRINSLEAKLAENQRDLYVLVGKIRELTRRHGDAPKNNGLKASGPNSMTATPRISRPITITIALLTGIVIGTTYFFAKDYVDQYFLNRPIWITQFFDFISGIAE